MNNLTSLPVAELLDQLSARGVRVARGAHPGKIVITHSHRLEQSDLDIITERKAEILEGLDQPEEIIVEIGTLLEILDTVGGRLCLAPDGGIHARVETRDVRKTLLIGGLLRELTPEILARKDELACSGVLWIEPAPAPIVKGGRRSW